MRKLLILLFAAAVACSGSSVDPILQSPVVTFEVPAAGAQLSAPQFIAAAGDGVTLVTFLLDDQVQLEDDTAPFEWTLVPASYTFGPHSLTVLVDTTFGPDSVTLPLILEPGPPTLTAIDPPAGPVGGGTAITLTGTNLTVDATVTVGGLAAADIVVTEYETITCATPAAVAAGPADVVVTTMYGSATLVDAFVYEIEDAPPPDDTVFPLSVHSSGRYLVQANGVPFLIHGDTPWSIAVQLTEGQVDDYLDDREYKGFNTILLNAIEAYFSSQTPAYRNANGDDPFGTMSPVDFTDPDEDYWAHVDYIVNEANKRGILCIINPAYLGYGGGKEGWHSTVNNTSDADLEDYGEFLAERYTQGNIIWCMGGDYVPSDISQQWNIVTGIRNIRTTDIITAHTGPGDEAYTDWKDETGFNLNNVYDRSTSPSTWWYDWSATAYARSGPMPFILLEARYDGEGVLPSRIRLQAYTALLSGACGHLFGNNPIWGFGEATYNGGNGAAAALSSALSTTATVQMTYLKELFDAYEWWKLAPSTGTALVTTSLGSGGSRICPALASDGSFAMIWKPASGSATVDLSAMNPSSVRARFFDPTDGTYASITGSPFSNSGTQSFSWSGEAVLVLDADP